jgi:hypothetical protein
MVGRLGMEPTREVRLGGALRVLRTRRKLLLSGAAMSLVAGTVNAMSPPSRRHPPPARWRTGPLVVRPPRQRRPGAGGTLSGRADLVSGGDALVEVVPAGTRTPARCR